MFHAYGAFEPSHGYLKHNLQLLSYHSVQTFFD